MLRTSFCVVPPKALLINNDPNSFFCLHPQMSLSLYFRSRSPARFTSTSRGNVCLVGWLSLSCKLRQQVKVSGIQSVFSCWDSYTPHSVDTRVSEEVNFAGTTQQCSQCRQKRSVPPSFKLNSLRCGPSLTVFLWGVLQQIPIISGTLR